MQQEIAAQLLKKYDFSAIYTSPLVRCQRVAELLTGAKPSLPLYIDPRLQEQNFGLFDGVPFDDLQNEWQVLEQFWANPFSCPLPEAEPLEQGVNRVIQAWEELIENCEQDTLVIAHGGPIRYILAHILGVDWKNPGWYTKLAIPNQSITHITLSRYQTQSFLRVNSIGCPLPNSSGD